MGGFRRGNGGATIDALGKAANRMSKMLMSIIVSLFFSASIAHTEASLDPILNSIVRIYLNRAVVMPDQTNRLLESERDRMVFEVHVYKYGSLRIEIQRIEKRVVVVDDGSVTTIWESACREGRSIEELLEEFYAGYPLASDRES